MKAYILKKTYRRQHSTQLRVTRSEPMTYELAMQSLERNQKAVLHFEDTSNKTLEVVEVLDTTRHHRDAIRAAKAALDDAILACNLENNVHLSANELLKNISGMDYLIYLDYKAQAEIKLQQLYLYTVNLHINVELFQQANDLTQQKALVDAAAEQEYVRIIANIVEQAAKYYNVQTRTLTLTGMAEPVYNSDELQVSRRLTPEYIYHLVKFANGMELPQAVIHNILKGVNGDKHTCRLFKNGNFKIIFKD